MRARMVYGVRDAADSPIRPNGACGPRHALPLNLECSPGATGTERRIWAAFMLVNGSPDARG
jgi:hypothetical protein